MKILFYLNIMWILVDVTYLFLAFSVTTQLPNLLQCPNNESSCSYFKPEKFYLNTLPMLCSLVVMLSVGGYITYKHFNPSGPIYTINLPAPIPLTNQPLQARKQPVHNLVGVENTGFNNEDVVQMPPAQATDAPPPPTVAWINSTPGNGSQEVAEIRIRRQDDNPFMFFKVPPPPPCLPPAGQCYPPPEQWLPPAAVAAFASIKKCLRLNIISLCILGLMIPENIVFIYTFMTGDVCHSESLKFVTSKIVVPFQIASSIAHPYLVRKKLHNFY